MVYVTRLQVEESSVLVLAGEWECSELGCWKFNIARNCLAQCIMVYEAMSYADVRTQINAAFESEVAGVVGRITYWPPSEMSMFASGKAPPVAINNDSSFKTFMKQQRQV